MQVSRRRLFGLLAAPAIVRVSSLMPVKLFSLEAEFEPELFVKNGLLTAAMITKEAVRLWKQSNRFLYSYEGLPSGL